MHDEPLTHRVDKCAHDWQVRLTTRVDTSSSVIAYGTCGARPVVLKVVRDAGEEWHVGATLEAFDGGGTVRVLAHVPGGVLLERLTPGTSLRSLVLAGRDDDATVVIADIIRRMAHPHAVGFAAATVEDWGQSFDRYLAGPDRSVPFALVERAHHVYRTLCGSQRQTRLLHGDLHHDNVLLDMDRGWVAIDPKGVVGEVEYEVGASLRNPSGQPALIASPCAVERRLRIFGAELGIDIDRALQWSFAQGVLSAIWSVEDGVRVDCTHTGLMLAYAIESLIP